MYTFFILTFIGVVNINLYEARPKINANLRNELYNSNYRQLDSILTQPGYPRPNQEHLLVDENQDVNIGNGHDRHNVIIVDERSKRRFDEGTNMNGIYVINPEEPNVRGIENNLGNRYGTNDKPQFHNSKPRQYFPNHRRTTDRNTIGIGINNTPNPNYGYNIADGNQILNIGNGRDNNNVVIVDKSSRLKFARNNNVINNPDTSNIHTNNLDLKQVYTPNFRQTSSINSIGNGMNNRNVVMINDNANESDRSATSIQNHIQYSVGNSKVDNSMYIHNSKNWPLYDTGITLRNRDASEEESIDYIGRGPGNNNIVIVNNNINI